jgi:hypothetical protein
MALSYRIGGCDSSVGIATRYGLDGPGCNPGGGKLSAPVQTGPEAHTASYKMDTWSLARG